MDKPVANQAVIWAGRLGALAWRALQSVFGGCHRRGKSMDGECPQGTPSFSLGLGRLGRRQNEIGGWL